MKADQNLPYVGPRPFQQSDRSIFAGRQRETREIVDEIFVNRLVVVFGRSGIGKTSLLRAGIIPQLEKEGFEVFPPARVSLPTPPGINAADVQNFYAFNCLREYVGHEADLIRQFTKRTLAEYLKERQHAVDSLKQPLLRALILDHIEELSDLPQFWQHRGPFFRQLHEALEQDHLLRVVILTREDALGSLESYANLLSNRPQARFRLEPMRREDALAALIEPLKETGVSFEPMAAEMMVDELSKIRIETSAGNFDFITGEFIEPLQLQLVAQRLWESLPAGKKVITIDDVKMLPAIEDVLSSFYDRAVREITCATGTDEKILRDWFEHVLITSSGTRNMVLAGRENTGGLPNRVVDQLVNSHIVRAVVQGGARWYELAHDRFVDPIRKSNQQYRTNG